jgi:hypothetical protein
MLADRGVDWKGQRVVVSVTRRPNTVATHGSDSSPQRVTSAKSNPSGARITVAHLT